MRRRVKAKREQQRKAIQAVDRAEEDLQISRVRRSCGWSRLGRRSHARRSLGSLSARF
jgi:hypothetical protein